MKNTIPILLIITICHINHTAHAAESPLPLSQQLKKHSSKTLAAQARRQGHAERGAILFYQPHMICTKCHLSQKGVLAIGPDLSKFDKEKTDEHLVDSILYPSKKLKKGYQTVIIETVKGKVITGVFVSEDEKQIVLRDAANKYQSITINKKEIDERTDKPQSTMPEGLVDQLSSVREFNDLLKYLMEIAEHGATRAKELEPNPALYAPRPLPDYEKNIDHAGMIAALNQKSYKRGAAIYNRLCINCHGTHNKPGSLPTSLKFAKDKFKHGHDPHTMYKTLTHGYGMMIAQRWMVPEQKYDVIHYIREAYLKKYNSSQYFDITPSYLAKLPVGTSKGPKPTNVEPWKEMDYGNNLNATYRLTKEIKDKGKFAYKGIAIRLDAGSGGVAKGKTWMLYDHDTLRLAAAWSGKEFVDWQALLFNGRHGIAAGIPKDVDLKNMGGPGWANPETGSFEEQRLVGRDGKRYGPLPKKWGEYKGLYHHGNNVILSYRIGDANILEMPSIYQTKDEQPVYTRNLEISKSSHDLVMKVAPKQLSVAVNYQADKHQFIRPKYIYNDGFRFMKIPKEITPLSLTVLISPMKSDELIKHLEKHSVIPSLTLKKWTKGGQRQWNKTLKTKRLIGKTNSAGFAIDTLMYPAKNPWNCRMRLTGLDFFPKDPNKMVVCAWDGDVWLITGLTSSSNELSWQRIASGLFQPLGIKVVDGDIYVGCRDQIVILRDLNGDGETDFYENFNSDHQVTEHFHEFAMGLQRDKAGNFYYAKSARHALKAIVPQHGTLLRVSKDGKKTDILATGFRAANGVCLNDDGTFIVTDQEGHWNPKNRINWVKQGGFYGNMFGYHDRTDSSNSAMEQPLCWITNVFDRSPAELLWVRSKKWGALNGKLLNLSYGYGKAYIVPHEEINNQKQGGMSPLPIPRFPTGIMRGRFNPVDGQLYLCGMVAWGSAQKQTGGLYRLRYAGKNAHVPIKLNATKTGMKITLSDPINKKSASDISRYTVKTWSLKRTANYGSKHYNEKQLKITKVTISKDGTQITLTIPDIEPTWCMSISYYLQGNDGKLVEGLIHNTVHYLGK